MLKLLVEDNEAWDEQKEEFVKTFSCVLNLEHSLVSLSKWEAIFEKPFLSKDEKTSEEVLGYIECMIVDPEIPPGVLSKLSDRNISDINAYIEAKSSATWFRDNPQTGPSEIITAEIIYYWMISFNIPFECEHWHLNRLFTLIRVCSEKNKKSKPRNRAEMLAERRRLNAERRAQYNTSG